MWPYVTCAHTSREGGRGREGEREGGHCIGGQCMAEFPLTSEDEKGVNTYMYMYACWYVCTFFSI